MFGFGKKIKQLEQELLIARIHANQLLEQRNELRQQWNDLVDRINKMGGEGFLRRGEAVIQKAQFSDEDLRRLLQLCHPDKHNGSALAVTMTAKLNQARA